MVDDNNTIETTVEQFWNQADSERLWNERLENAELSSRTGVATDEHWQDSIAEIRQRRDRADETLDRARMVNDKLADVQLDLVRGRDAADSCEAAQDALSMLSQANLLSFADDLEPESETLSEGIDDLGVDPSWEKIEAKLVNALDGEVTVPDEKTANDAVSLFDEVAVIAREVRDKAADEFRETVGEAYEGIGDPMTGLGEEPLLLAPVQLETRFVDEETTFAGDIDVDHPELWIRVSPDQFHADTHESALTDRERRWGEYFWTTLWLAHVGHADSLEKLPDDRLGEFAETVDLDRYRRDPIGQLKSRIWDRLVERFGEKRATYVIHTLSPTDGEGTDLGPELLAETPTDALGDRSEPTDHPHRDTIVTEPAGLSFPETPGKADSWTKQSEDRLLPDRWIAVLEWEEDGERRTKTVEGNPIPEPLRSGPDPEPRADDSDDPEDWVTDFKAAYKNGMALRVDLTRLRGYDEEDPSEEFTRVIVLGVKLSLPASEGPTALREHLLDHRYTDGFSLVPSGTPTNVPERASTGALEDNPAGLRPPVVENEDESEGDDDATDGELFARALGIQAESGQHPFGHVRGVDNTEQLDQRHANTVLWSATLGYTMQHQWVPDALVSGDANGSHELAVQGLLLKLDQYRRHFIYYVRPRGPFPTIRFDDQPYGLLPVRTPSDAALGDDDVEAQTVEFEAHKDLQLRDEDDFFFEGKDVVSGPTSDPHGDLSIDDVEDTELVDSVDDVDVTGATTDTTIDEHMIDPGIDAAEEEDNE